MRTAVTCILAAVLMGCASEETHLDWHIHCLLGHIESLDIETTGPGKATLPIHKMQEACDSNGQT